MNDNEKIDTFLQHLYDKGNNGAYLEDVVSVDKAQRDRIQIKLTGKGLIQEVKSYVGGKRRFRISAIGVDILNEYDSYSAYLDNLDKDHKKTTRINNVNMALAITSIVIFIYGAVFTWLTFSKENQVDRLETENSTLQTAVDSLTKEIEGLKAKQTVVPPDSLRALK